MSASLWGRPRKFVVDNFPLSIYMADSQSPDIAATELGGPGFVYVILVVDRTGIKTCNGKAIAKD